MSKSPNQLKCLDVIWEGHPDCLHCPIRKIDIMAGVDVVKFGYLLKRIIRFSYSEKNLLFVEDTPARDMYVIRNGLIKLENTLTDGSSRIVRLLAKGDVVGLEAFLNSHQGYDQTAIALHKTDVCRIPHQVLKDLLKTDPDFYKSVLKQWHIQLEAANKVVVDFSTGSLKQRVASVLLMLIDRANQDKRIEIMLLPIDDVAALTGVAKESVSRVMAEFKRNKLLVKSAPNKMRFDEAGLRKMANNYSV